MKFKSFIILIFVLVFGCKSYLSTDIREGILYLPEDWEGKTIPLTGEWEIFWNSWEKNSWIDMDGESLDTSNISNNSNSTDGQPKNHGKWVKVPSSWNSYNPSEDKAFGIASFRLRIKNIPIGKRLYFKIKNQSTASSFYINRELVSRSGVVGDSPETSKPQYRVDYINHLAIENELEIILTVSNYHHSRGGYRYPIELGSADSILTTALIQAGFEFLVMGSILGMGIFHIFLYFINNKKPEYLYFSIFCFLNGLRLFVLDNFYITYFFPDTSWQFLVKMDYATTPIVAPLFLGYLFHSYPLDVKKIQLQVVSYMSVAVSLVVLTTPPTIFTSILLVNNTIVGISIFMTFYIVLKVNHYKREDSSLLLAGTFILLAFGVHDLLAGSRVIESDLRFPVGLILFFIIQVIIVSKKKSRIFNDSIKLKKDHHIVSRNLETLNKEYSKFVPREILHLMEKQNIIDVKYGDNVSKKIAILSSDIRDFTSFSESMNPKDNFNFLNAYLKRVSPLVRKNNGIIDKYIGDAIIALYPNGSQNAIDTAIQMHQVVNDYNQIRVKKGNSPIGIGVGIHQGEGLLGIIGDKDRMQTSAVSESIYLASIIEGLTKKYGAKILISVEALYASEVFDKYPFRMVDSIKIVPEAEPLGIVEILLEGIDETSNLKIEYKDIFERGVYAFLEGDFQQASDLFEVMISQIDQDEAARIYYHRSQKYLKYGAPPGWQKSDSMEI